MTVEAQRLEDPRQWRKWGPYLSDRQWGVVREDYTGNGDAWNAVSHDMARSKAYRWGEDGIGGFSDDRQLLCLALCLWNGRDPILKERFFGLTNAEGNHGEDVKELYYHLDGTPTHSYMKMLYKYPQAAFPYDELVLKNRGRSRLEPEYEILDTGIFDEDRYFDVEIEFGKAGPEDILAQYTVHNRADEDAEIHLLPTLWLRRTKGWKTEGGRPSISVARPGVLRVESPELGTLFLHLEDGSELLFTENETNLQRLFHTENIHAHVKDGIHERVVHGKESAVNPDKTGTKAAAWWIKTIPPGGQARVRVRLSPDESGDAFGDFDSGMDARRAEMDEFYAELQKHVPDEDERRVQRAAWAGMLWNKQFYYFNVTEWLEGDEGRPKPPETRRKGRNSEWKHLMAQDVISMPDKWEYPWFAAWDLAFHCITFAPIDPAFAKEQLLLLLCDRYMHPNGQIPAYEWNLGDVNPPVHAMAGWKIYQIEAALTGKGDRLFLEKLFHRLALNFTWWVNRKDSRGNNIFQGGFLGLDNIGVFDRGAPLPGGGHLEQADGTSWMAAYALNLMRIAMELALEDPVYEEMAIKFGQHFFYIADAMTNMGNVEGQGLWDEEEGFYYDIVRRDDGEWTRLRLRSIVGLIPLFAVEVIDDGKWAKLERFSGEMRWFLEQRPGFGNLVSRWQETGGQQKHLLSLLRGHRMKALLRRMLDESEFLSIHGVRSLSAVYREEPYSCEIDGLEQSVRYTPAESDGDMFGGNSNWRGPVWLPINYMIIESLYRFHDYYGDDFLVEYPTGSGRKTTLKKIAEALSQRVASLFQRGENSARPALPETTRHCPDRHFADLLLFHEYFNGDNGEGLGASHQTGWTGLVALLRQRSECVGKA